MDEFDLLLIRLDDDVLGKHQMRLEHDHFFPTQYHLFCLSFLLDIYNTVINPSKNDF